MVKLVSTKNTNDTKPKIQKEYTLLSPKASAKQLAHQTWIGPKLMCPYTKKETCNQDLLINGKWVHKDKIKDPPEDIVTRHAAEDPTTNKKDTTTNGTDPAQLPQPPTEQLNANPINNTKY